MLCSCNFAKKRYEMWGLVSKFYDMKLAYQAPHFTDISNFFQNLKNLRKCSALAFHKVVFKNLFFSSNCCCRKVIVMVPVKNLVMPVQDRCMTIFINIYFYNHSLKPEYVCSKCFFIYNLFIS